jgi:hypothetical protein
MHRPTPGDSQIRDRIWWWGGGGDVQFYKVSLVPYFFQTVSLFMGQKEGIHIERIDFMDVHR